MTPELEAAEGALAQEQAEGEPDEEPPQEEPPEGEDLEEEEEVQVEETPPEKGASDHDHDGKDNVEEIHEEMVEDSEGEVEKKLPDRKGKNSKGGKGKKEKGKGKSKGRNKGKGKAGKKDGWHQDRGDRQGYRGHEGRDHNNKSQGHRRREGRDWKDQGQRSQWLKRAGTASRGKKSGASVWSEEPEEPLRWSDEDEDADEEPVRERSSSARSANPRHSVLPKTMPRLAGRGAVVLPPRKKPRNDEDPSTAGK